MHDSALDRDQKGGRGELPPAFEPLRVLPDPLKRGIPPQRPLRLWINSAASCPEVPDMMHRHRRPQPPPPAARPSLGWGKKSSTEGAGGGKEGGRQGVYG